MKINFYAKIFVCLSAIILLNPVTIKPKSLLVNVIWGFIFDEKRNPVKDIYVELLTDIGTTLLRTKTDGTGRYTFNNVSSGSFKVKVIPQGTTLIEQIKDVTITNFSSVNPSGGLSIGGSQMEQVDFYLKQKKDALSGDEISGNIFVQEIPKAAELLYKEALKNFAQNKKDTALTNLKESLEIFPDYFLALERLGTEYVQIGLQTEKSSDFFEAGKILLSQAVKINPRSFSSFYGLGLAEFKLKSFKNSVTHFEQAVSLNASSINANLWLGIALRQTGNLEKAEPALLKAKKLTQTPIAEIHFQLAQIYNQMKRYKETADELEAFLKAQPDAKDAEKIKAMIKQLREK